jgi:hypothetical protein
LARGSLDLGDGDRTLWKLSKMQTARGGKKCIKQHRAGALTADKLRKNNNPMNTSSSIYRRPHWPLILLLPVTLIAFWPGYLMRLDDSPWQVHFHGNT